jgi:hypothetical protein
MQRQIEDNWGVLNLAHSQVYEIACNNFPTLALVAIRTDTDR